MSIDTEPLGTLEAPAVEILGPFPGTPEGAFVFPICLNGRHEKFVTSHGCKGGFWSRGKSTRCGCSCHTASRGLIPGAEFEIPHDPAPDPMKVTLSDELHTWAVKHGQTKPIVEKKEKITADSYNETTGRRARGALEQQVLEVCKDYTTGGFDSLEAYREQRDDEDDLEYVGHVFLDVKLISDEIDLRYGQGKPSTGAIANVLERWDKIGFAITRDKPIAFLIFSPLSNEMSLDRMKERYRLNNG